MNSSNATACEAVGGPEHFSVSLDFASNHSHFLRNLHTSNGVDVYLSVIVFLSCACMCLFTALVFILVNLNLSLNTKHKHVHEKVERKHVQNEIDRNSSAALVDCSRRKEENLTYLDHAGATLYKNSQIDEFANLLKDTTFGNPHTSGPASRSTETIVANVREEILNHFGVSGNSHVLVFTSGTTAGLKIVGESFQWTKNSVFCYQQMAHTSVIGLREYALREGALFECLHYLVDVEEKLNSLLPSGNTNTPLGLIALTAECNFSGVKTDLDVVQRIKSSKGAESWRVLLDAAKFAGTNPLNLSKVKADYTVISFYKMFGFPAGLGGLIMTREAAEELKPTYFGGGNIKVCACDTDFKELHTNISKRFESGTQNFLGIVAAHFGFKQLRDVGMQNIQAHTYDLAQRLYLQLSSLCHENGQKVCKMYGNHHLNDPRKQGSIVTFNAMDKDGGYISHIEIGRLASLNNIQIRTGMFCNPGASQKYFGLTTEQISNYSGEHGGCWEEVDILESGIATGAVRVSVGYSSTLADILVFVNFMKTYFVTKDVPAKSFYTERSKDSAANVVGIYVYPIKSCAGICAKSWPLNSSGFLYDRNWVLVDSEGESLDQKKIPKMCLIVPDINLSTQTMTIRARILNPPEPLKINLSFGRNTKESDMFRICDRLQPGESMCRDVSFWFSSVLGIQCRLIQNIPNPKRSFANRGQLLMISRSSVRWLKEKLEESEHDCHVDDGSFRANIVLDGCQPHEEDSWSTVCIGDTAKFQIAGPCNRCPMVNVNQNTGEQNRNILLALAKYRRCNSHINFGQFLSIQNRFFTSISVGNPVKIIK
uniref:Molybdenum cofactor sulfurase n=1 Tax=Aplanochytrium stocchinoi TaxID=215587 RepID=A0A7S3PP43_9STRA